jgi:hypothetical protein
MTLRQFALAMKEIEAPDGDAWLALVVLNSGMTFVGALHNPTSDGLVRLDVKGSDGSDDPMMIDVAAVAAIKRVPV